MRSIEELIEAIQGEAHRAAFPVDRPVYERAGIDPMRPVLFAGSLDASVAVMGRDLGRDEVAAGQPLIGAGGRLVRQGFYKAAHGELAPSTDRAIASVLDRVLLTNTVPYKPPGNKAYATSVKERFRPFVAELLGGHWSGRRVITLGNEAFQWFAPYAVDPTAFADFWKREDRYEGALEVSLRWVTPGTGRAVVKPLTLLPLPHPSPLNARWYGLFPGLLARRLEVTERAAPGEP